MKKFLSFVLSFIFLLLSFSFILILGLRVTFSKSNVAEIGGNEVKEEYVSEILEGIYGDAYDTKMDSYINFKTFEKMFINYTGDFIYYKAGVMEDKPNAEKFVDYFTKAMNKYKEETGKEVSTSQIKKYFDYFDETILDELEDVSVFEDDTVKIFLKLMDVKYMIILPILMVLVLFLKVRFTSSLKGIGVSSIIASILGILVAVFFKSLDLDFINKTFVTMLVLSILFLVIGLVLLLKKKKEVE